VAAHPRAVADGSDGTVISIPGLWGLAFAPGTTTLFFASGPNDESHGLVGMLSAR